MEKLYLTPEERECVQSLLRKGLRLQKSDPQWLIARLAIARSLQIADAPSPEDFGRPAYRKGGSELHYEQVTGLGKGPDDVTDVFKAILSIYHNRDFFADEAAFEEAMQRHLRRGLREIDSSWRERFDFHDYLFQEMYFELRGDGGGSIEPDSSALRDRVSRVLGQLGIGADIETQHEGPRLTRFTIELHGLDDLDRFRRGLDKLAFALGLGENTLSQSLAPGERKVFLHVPRPTATWKTITWQDVRGALATPEAGAMILPICIGTDVLGEPFVRDLAEAPHLFIGGTTGSGKSMCIHSILLSLLSGPHALPELVLIDPKAVEFSNYEGVSSIQGGGPVTDTDDAFAALNRLVEEMQERQERLKALDARNIAEANERGANLRRIVVVIDELADLILTRRDIDLPLIRLAQKARSAGIHLVLATQRPEAATFPGLLRSNIPSRIALTVQKAAESRIILDEGGAEGLLMRGDMLVRFAGHHTVRAHGCRIEPNDIVSVVRRI